MFNIFPLLNTIAKILKNERDPEKKQIAFDLKNEKEIEKALEAGETICHLVDKFFLYKAMDAKVFEKEYIKQRKIFFKND